MARMPTTRRIPLLRDKLDLYLDESIKVMVEAMRDKTISPEKRAKVACDIMNWRFRLDAEQRKIEIHKEDLAFKRTSNLMKDYDLSEKEEAFLSDGDKTTQTNPSFSTKVVGE